MKASSLLGGRHRSFFLVPPVLALLGCQAAAQSADPAPGGSPPGQTGGQTGTGAGMSAADLSQCRADLLQTLASYREILRTDGRWRVDQASETVTRLGPKDMQALGAACSRVRLLAQLVATARDLPKVQTATARLAGPAAAATFPAAPYSGRCGSARSDTETIFALQVALQVARGVWSAASRGCDEVVAGFNTSLVCIAADEILYVAEAALEDVAFCDEDIDSAEIYGTYARVGFVHDQVVVLDGKVDLVMQKLDALARAIEGLRQLGCDALRVGHTPEGRRESAVPVCSDQPGFPYAWPQR
jgi:hypothetical protein